MRIGFCIVGWVVVLGACGGNDKGDSHTTDAADTFDAVSFDATNEVFVPDVPDSTSAFETTATATDTTTSDADDDVAACTFRPFDFQCPCDINSDCASTYCLPVDDPDAASRCTRTCITDCPDGWECKGVSLGGADPLFLCTPPIETLCHACTNDGDCREVGAKCVPYPDGNFCGRGCIGAPEACPAGFGCSEIKNDLGQVTSYQCTPDGGSCVCPVGTDYDSDPDNCGFCGHSCSYPFGVAACDAKQCLLSGCQDGHQDLNRTIEDGCEYACTFVSSDDIPDATCDINHSCDQDCDGIDGTWSRAVFVSASGTRNGSGAPYDPIASIQAGIALAVQLGKDHVYVAGGSYTETVDLHAGVSVFGGYSNDNQWRRDLGQYNTIIQASTGTSSIRVVSADGVTTPTRFDGFVIQAGTNANPGGSSYAVWVRNSNDQLVLANLAAVGGNGGPGQDGGGGTAGLPGLSGGSARATVDCDCDCNNFNTQGGDGGTAGAAQCTTGANANGGKGGKAGCKNDGSTKGDHSPGGAAGGPAVGSKANGQNGASGGGGSGGTDGSAGGATGEVVSGFWRGLNGGNGDNGHNGVGGGGGSGGGGDNNSGSGASCQFGLCAAWGGGGGGGGSGGCGGTPGAGGTAGGASFGLFLSDASPTITNVQLGHKSGGNGGKGGKGGDGGSGGPLGPGGDGFEDGGKGGDGGRGGVGGRGGHGGGGAGGVAYGLYISGASDPRCTNVGYAPDGAGGGGGIGGVSADGAGNRGADGLSDDRNKATPSCP